ncbi:MAG: hypothetical protein AB1344_09650 [Pseudomonadota bacterium]
MLLLMLPPAQAEVYRLDNGAHYTDSLSPDRAREGYTVLDKEGREVRKVAPVIPPEQQEEARRRLAEQRERQRLEQQQAQRDHMLLKLYASEDAILAAREARLESLDSRHAVLSGQMVSARQRLELLERDDPQSVEIPHLRRRIASSQETVRALLGERQAETERFDADLERWRYLKQTGTRPVVQAPPGD